MKRGMEMPENKTATQQELTIDTFVKLFFTNFQVETKDQLKNMVFAVIGFCRCFQNTDEQIKELKMIYNNPLRYIIEKEPSYFSEEQVKRLIKIKQKLGRIEWVYFRDTHRFTKLKKEYYSDENTPKRQKYFSLAESVDVRDYSKLRISEIFVDVAILNSVPLNPMMLPDLAGMTNPIKPVGVEDFEK